MDKLIAALQKMQAGMTQAEFLLYAEHCPILLTLMWMAGGVDAQPAIMEAPE